MKILLLFPKYLQKSANNLKNMTLSEAKFLILILEKKENELLTFIDEYSRYQENINNLCAELEEKLNTLKVDAVVLIQIFQYLADNQKIMAIKLCINQLGHTLTKAKTFTDKLEKDFSNFLNNDVIKAETKSYIDEMLQTCAANNDDVFIDRIIALLRKNKKLEAIKLAKETKKIGLKEAKDFVETFNIRLD
jgi:ribosomal protein L7/L12